jgi:hypothetical protein
LDLAVGEGALDRRSFLRRWPRSARFGSRPCGGGADAKRAGADRAQDVYTHCSVGCTVRAEVENGVWVRQQPKWGSPINRGTQRRPHVEITPTEYLELVECEHVTNKTRAPEVTMNGLIYLIGLIVVIMFILSFLGLR